ncbi:hypothetical protein RAMDARK_0390 [Rickettsia amblyommatis str. Darkwater]|uniref:Uncharacterized protein n=1 Tax=Rickettsia amblyommatis str. Ac/Pa TaxID=1359164 RepID=A0A0F3N0U3_RICAM|nr:hypothetical protein APHACPA_0619 [Rickettsia amblyommatis str. Ac/Pa]KJV97478.1 hypothetical protein RAMDARK_0390 [Rickettsia amblyommatis str. Darkwater]
MNVLLRILYIVSSIGTSHAIAPNKSGRCVSATLTSNPPLLPPLIPKILRASNILLY